MQTLFLFCVVFLHHLLKFFDICDNFVKLGNFLPINRLEGYMKVFIFISFRKERKYVMRKKKVSSLAEWKELAMVLSKMDLSIPEFKNALHYTKAKIRLTEARVGICRVLCLIALFSASCGVSGCFESTGRSLGVSIKALSDTGNAFWNDVGDGLIELNDQD
jgi:hypothetical protein